MLFKLFDTLPILKYFTGADYELLFSRIPPEDLKRHLRSDTGFIEELVAHCRASGIPIKIDAQGLMGLMYPLVLAVLHRGELGDQTDAGGIDVLRELVAAYCVGDVKLGRKIRSPREKELA